MGAAAIPVALVAATGYEIYSGQKSQQQQQKQLSALAGQQPPPTTPAPTPANNDAANQIMQQQKKLSAMRYGFASTITNMSPANPTGLKKTLGS